MNFIIKSPNVSLLEIKAAKEEFKKSILSAINNGYFDALVTTVDGFSSERFVVEQKALEVFNEIESYLQRNYSDKIHQCVFDLHNNLFRIYSTTLKIQMSSKLFKKIPPPFRISIFALEDNGREGEIYESDDITN